LNRLSIQIAAANDILQVWHTKSGVVPKLG